MINININIWTIAKNKHTGSGSEYFQTAQPQQRFKQLTFLLYGNSTYHYDPPQKNKNKDTFVKHRKGTTEKASSAAVSLHQLTRRWDPSMNPLADGDSDNR